jgi:flotillin
VVGGGTLVMPLFQKADEFNLELMSFDVAPNYALYTNQGIPVTIEAITQLKVENEDEKIKRAANQFLSKRDDDRQTMVRQVMEGHLRGIVGQLTVEELIKDPEMVSGRMRNTVAADLDKLGLEVVSFTLKDVSDESGYIENMSRPEIAHNKQVAEIAEAEALRNVAIRSAETLRESAQAQARADQERVLAQSISKTAQSEAQRDLDVKQAEYMATVSAQKAQADRAYDIQTSIIQQRQVEEQSKVEIIRKQQEVKVQQAEGERMTAELVATVQRQAEAENERIRILAEAEQRRTIIEAEGRARSARLQAEAEANAIRVRAEADAGAIRARGLAEAEALQARGLAEAEALQRRVAVLNNQNQAALLDKALSNLPEIAGKLSEAYSKIGSITYIGSGEGDSITSRVTRDIVGMVPMLGAMFESTTGMNLRDLIKGRNGNGAAHSIEGMPEGSEVRAVVAPDTVAVVPVASAGSVNGGEEETGS